VIRGDPTNNWVFSVEYVKSINTLGLVQFDQNKKKKLKAEERTGPPS
jgi:hypothetical protein